MGAIFHTGERESEACAVVDARADGHVLGREAGGEQRPRVGGLGDAADLCPAVGEGRTWAGVVGRLAVGRVVGLGRVADPDGCEGR